MSPGWDHGQRLRQARARLRAMNARALLVGVGADLVYLTGYRAMPLERLTMLVLPAAGPAVLLAPRLEADAATASAAVVSGDVAVVPWDETDDAHALVAAHLETALGEPPSGRMLVSATLWASHLLSLQRVLPACSFGLTSDVLRDLRAVKEPGEVELLRRAAHAADRVIAQVAAGALVGRTEAAVSREIRERLVAEGHEEATFAIVASGPNAASPHHDPGERVISPGEPVVLDIGGTLGGYGSDITRTIWVTGRDGQLPPHPEFVEIYGIVRAAQAEATAAVRPGIACGALDAIARQLITDSGYGAQFVHRLGHGIGLEGHEDPYLVDGNDEPLEPGMSFSIEPGIYLPGRWGVRIEDIVVCDDSGPLVLNEASRDLQVVPG